MRAKGSHKKKAAGQRKREKRNKTEIGGQIRNPPDEQIKGVHRIGKKIAKTGISKAELKGGRRHGRIKSRRGG